MSVTDYPDLGTVKRGASFTATFVTTIEGQPQDYTETGWVVEAQARLTLDSTEAVEFTIADGPLAQSTIVAVLAPADTAVMAAGTWLVDVKVTDPGGDVTYSDTYALTVEQAVTREVLVDA